MATGGRSLLEAERPLSSTVCVRLLRETRLSHDRAVMLREMLKATACVGLALGLTKGEYLEHAANIVNWVDAQE